MARTQVITRQLATATVALVGLGCPALLTSSPALAATTVRIDPSYQQPPFEGWGTSLVWFANATGGYPDPIRTRLVDLVFGADGLNLNIARYNIGGGNAPDVRADYMKVGTTMPGFWQAPPGTTVQDTGWWDPGNPDHWNWNADANQRWWIDQITDKIDHWEAFSNSPPWFQTVSGYVSGGFDASTDQIRSDRVDEFATYLVRVTEHLERAHGIRFDTIDPLNEPNTNYWGTALGPDGQPTGGRQEGAHAGPALQQQVVLALRDALDQSTTGAVVSAMDETNPSIFTQNWNAYDAPARAAVDQLNVHTYGTGMRTAVRDIAKAEDKPLWMSEVEGTWGSATDFTGMEPGLGIAARIVGDLRELEPSAWVLWQPIEDAGPQAASGKNWGSIHVPFTCGPDATPETCPIQLNTKFDTIRNFTHYIRPGDRLVAVNDPSSVAAIRPASDAATVVSVNAGLSPRAVTLDLSGFGTIAQRSTVTPVVSSAAGGLVRGDAVAVSGTSVALTVPAQSVTTFLIDGVSGVGTGLVQPNHVYRLSGVQSGRCLVPASSSDPAGAPTGIVIATTDESRVDQLWSLRPMTAEAGNRTRYTIVNVGTGQRLAARDGVAVLEDPPATGTTGNTRSTGDSSAQWIMSTTGDGTWTFVNAGTGRLLDVSGQATADGSPVSTWTPTSGPNQRWTVIDETVLATSQVTTYTLPGLAPVLPGTVGAVYRDGCRGTLPVTWSRVPDHRWRTPGTVRVRGTATDPLGRTIPAEAIVTVDTFSSTRPARAKAYLGGQPDLPATVTGIGDHGGTAELPVTWDPIAGGSPGAAGVTTLPGLARLVDGTTVDATVRIQTTEPVRVNAALDPGVVASATFTESGYSAEALRNGETTDKGWLYDATATAIEGTPVPDFHSETTSYELAACFSGRRPDVAVTPSDPYAEVAVTVDRRRRGLIAIDVTITSEDGSRTETYRITVARC